MVSFDSITGLRKGNLMLNENQKSSRKLSLRGSRVRFDCGEFSEADEDAKFK